MRSPFLRYALLSIALLSSAASAQTYFLLGGGLDFARFRFDLPSGATSPDQGSRTGLNAVLGFQSFANDHGSTVLSLAYEQRGGIFENQGPSEDMDVTIKFDYIHLGFAYKFLSSQNGPGVYMAPNVDLAFLINSEAEADGNTGDIDDVNSIDMDLGVTLGFQAPMGRNAFFLEGGYAHGLFNTETGEMSDDVSIKNSCIKLRLGFLIGT